MAKTQPQEQIETIVHAHVPLGEDEDTFQSIKLKVERHESLSKQEEKLLERLAGKAKKWEDEVQSSADTELEYTLPG